MLWTPRDKQILTRTIEAHLAEWGAELVHEPTVGLHGIGFMVADGPRLGALCVGIHPSACGVPDVDSFIEALRASDDGRIANLA